MKEKIVVFEQHWHKPWCALYLSKKDNKIIGCNAEGYSKEEALLNLQNKVQELYG